MNKEDCQKLYQEYQELRKKTEVNVYTKEIGKDYHSQHIKAGDIPELNKAKQKLISCLDFFSDDELIKITNEDDSELKAAAEKILKKRRGVR